VILKTIAVATKVWAAAQLLLNIALTANPIGIVVVAIAALVGGLIYAYKNSERFRLIVNKAFQVVKAAVLPVVNIIRVVVPKAFGVLVSLVRGYITTYIGIVRRVFQVVKFFVQLPARILAAVGDLGAVLFESGKDLIRGLVNGIKSMAAAPVNAVKGVGGKIKDGFTGFLGIGSPSKVFAGYGVNINEGLVQGMKRSDALLRKGAQGAAGTLTQSFRATPGVPVPGATRRPQAASGGNGDHIEIHNPVPERASESVARAIQRKKHRAGWSPA
jgi:phage-related protein